MPLWVQSDTVKFESERGGVILFESETRKLVAHWDLGPTAYSDEISDDTTYPPVGHHGMRDPKAAKIAQIDRPCDRLKQSTVLTSKDHRGRKGG